jgi:toxin ParE1/3/4
MKSLVWTPSAEADLQAIDDHWRPLEPAMADHILDSIRAAAQFLRGVPQGGSLIEQGDVRKWPAGSTSYLLIYRIRAETVEILRIHRDRQDGRPA